MKCDKCEKKIGIFSERIECEECGKVYCENCKSEVQECDECEGNFCNEHIKTHEHEEDSDDESEEDEETPEEECIFQQNYSSEEKNWECSLVNPDNYDTLICDIEKCPIYKNKNGGIKNGK